MNADRDRTTILNALQFLTERGIDKPTTETLVLSTGWVHPFEVEHGPLRRARMRALRRLSALEAEGRVNRTEGHGDWAWEKVS